MFMLSREEVLSEILVNAGSLLVSAGAAHNEAVSIKEEVDLLSEQYLKLIVHLEEKYDIRMSRKELSLIKTLDRLASYVVSIADENDAKKMLKWFMK